MRPYSKRYVAASPLGSTTPFSVADVCPISLAGVVPTAGGSTGRVVKVSVAVRIGPPKSLEATSV